MATKFKAEECDIVYLVKECSSNEELRYSLRSVSENFKYRKIWIYGGRPSYIQPDEYVHCIQNQGSKWLRTTAMIKKICENPEISEDWWLFNDDFFVMKKTKGIPAAYHKDIYWHIVHIENRHGMKSTLYTKQLRDTATALERAGLPVLNYALHMPMLINKEKALATLEAFPGSPMFRSLYGNYNKIGGKDMKDCKVSKIDRSPDEEAVFLSTTDDTFACGKAGAFIRDRFPEPCKYEL